MIDETKFLELEKKVNDIDKYLKEDLKDLLANHVEGINTTIYNIDIIYELMFALIKHAEVILIKDNAGVNIVDVELNLPKIDQNFLLKFAEYVFDLKNSTKNSKLVTPEEINKLCEQKIEEMLKNE